MKNIGVWQGYENCDKNSSHLQKWEIRIWLGWEKWGKNSWDVNLNCEKCEIGVWQGYEKCGRKKVQYEQSIHKGEKTEIGEWLGCNKSE